MSAVQNLIQQFIAAAAAEVEVEAPPAQEQEYYDDEQKIGSVLMEDGAAGADIWAYFEDGEAWLEFRGWRIDGSWWCLDCHVDDRIDTTLKAVCSVVHIADVQYIRVTSLVYSVDMPDCSVTRSATLNQCIDFPDQRWIDVRDQEDWYDIHMVVRRS
jgi:hypothetical protein